MMNGFNLTLRARCAALCGFVLIGATLAPASTSAATLRVGVSGDAATMDPHSQAVLNTYQLLMQVYEPLIGKGRKLEPVPALAIEWKLVDPTRWRFKLRPNVKFHEGQVFTARDVAFTLKRAGQPSSNYRNYLDTLAKVEIVDDLTVDFVTTQPDPIFPEKLSDIRMMSEAWSEQNGAGNPAQVGSQQSAYAAIHENGTGPFRLIDRRPNVRTTLARFEGWWGESDGNVTEYVYIPIVNGATRVAALVSGEIDIILDVPIQDIPRLEQNNNVRILQGPEIRTLHIVLDQKSDELKSSSIKGKNPFKDLRVRQALYQAIDIDSITNRIMRGFAIPAGIQVAPGINGYVKEYDTRLPYDQKAAKDLLVAAGYPDGFDFTLDCPNNRYQNDEAVCQALVALWARIGVRAQLNPMPLQTYFPKVQAKNSDAFLLGTGAPTSDALYSLQINYLPPGAPGDGLWSLGYSNDQLSAFAARAKFEMNPDVRLDLLKQAWGVYKKDIPSLPLYHSVGIWAARKTVTAEYRSDGVLEAKFVTVGP